jgi:hypothetical protein
VAQILPFVLVGHRHVQKPLFLPYDIAANTGAVGRQLLDGLVSLPSAKSSKMKLSSLS